MVNFSEVGLGYMEKPEVRGSVACKTSYLKSYPGKVKATQAAYRNEAIWKYIPNTYPTTQYNKVPHRLKPIV